MACRKPWGIPLSPSLLAGRDCCSAGALGSGFSCKVLPLEVLDSVVSIFVPLTLINVWIELATGDYSGYVICVLHATKCLTLYYWRTSSKKWLLSFLEVSQLFVFLTSCTCCYTFTALIMHTTELYKIILSAWPVGASLWTTTTFGYPFSIINFV